MIDEWYLTHFSPEHRLAIEDGKGQEDRGEQTIQSAHEQGVKCTDQYI